DFIPLSFTSIKAATSVFPFTSDFNSSAVKSTDVTVPSTTVPAKVIVILSAVLSYATLASPTAVGATNSIARPISPASFATNITSVLTFHSAFVASATSDEEPSVYVLTTEL